jgi:hypothetical protein
MKKLAMSLAVALATLLVASCGTSNTTSYCPDLFTDTVLPEPTFFPGQNWDVTYTVSTTGGAPVNSIQYRDASGILVTVNNPVLPWSYSMVNKAPGTRITLVASAVAPPGTVTVDVLAVINAAGGGESRHWNDSCGDLLE